MHLKQRWGAALAEHADATSCVQDRVQEPAETLDEPAVVLDRVAVNYGHHRAVANVSGSLLRGTMTALVGPNGAGKTSLLAALAGSMLPSQGTVRWAAGAGKHIAYLPQQSGIDRSFPIQAIDLVMLGYWQRLGVLRAASSLQRSQALQAMTDVGLDGLEHRSISEFSTGQFQRLLFARVMLQNAQLILLDEPFASVDAHTSVDLLKILHRWKSERRTVVAALHDVAQAREHFDQALLLAREPIIWGPSQIALSTPNLERAQAIARGWEHGLALAAAPARRATP